MVALYTAGSLTSLLSVCAVCGASPPSHPLFFFRPLFHQWGRCLKWGLMASLRVFASHGGSILSRGWLASVEAPRYPRHLPFTYMRQLVNSICTFSKWLIFVFQGGTHVNYVTDQIVEKLMIAVKRKNKGGIEVKPFQIKNHLWVFINCLIENPSFDSQTKENMTLRAKAFGSTCDFSDKFIKQVWKFVTCNVKPVLIKGALFTTLATVHSIKACVCLIQVQFTGGKKRSILTHANLQ